jgi:hypothetical protein
LEPAEGDKRPVMRRLRFYTPEVAPLDYAATQNNLGLAYRNLASHEEPVGNLRKAIEAYE